MDNKDVMLTEFFTKVKNDCIYTQFAQLNHELFVQIMEKFKEYAGASGGNGGKGAPLR